MFLYSVGNLYCFLVLIHKILAIILFIHIIINQLFSSENSDFIRINAENIKLEKLLGFTFLLINNQL